MKQKYGKMVAFLVFSIPAKLWLNDSRIPQDSEY